MITIKEAEEILKKEYHLDNFTYLMSDILLPDFIEDRHEVTFDNQIFTSVTMLGISSLCDVTIFEVYLKEGTQNRRVAITQEIACANFRCSDIGTSLIESIYSEKIIDTLPLRSRSLCVPVPRHT